MIFVGMLGAAFQLQAQPKTMVALFKTKFGKMPAFVGAMQKTTIPALDQLLAQGVIQAYGLDTDVLHTGGPNMALWFSAPSYGAIQKANEAVMGSLEKHPAEAAAIGEAADLDAHTDLLLEVTHAKFGKIPAGALPVTNLSLFRVKTGKDKDWERAAAKYFQPLYDKLVDDGVIYGYQYLAQGMHTENPGDTWFLVSMPDMSAMDKIDAAFAARMKAMSADERSIFEHLLPTLQEDAEHRDYIMRSIAFKAN